MLGDPGKHVLIVEDDAALTALLRMVAEEEDLHVSSVRRGDEAFALIAGNPNLYDCVLLDLQLPGLHGSKVIQKLDRLGDRTRIIICSGHIVQDQYFRISDYKSVISCHTKPVDLEVLREIFRGVTSGQEPQDITPCDSIAEVLRVLEEACDPVGAPPVAACDRQRAVRILDECLSRQE